MDQMDNMDNQPPRDGGGGFDGDGGFDGGGDGFDDPPPGDRNLQATSSSSNSTNSTATYEERVKKISKYFQFLGMFELRQKTDYTPYNNINQDLYTWKTYNDTTEELNNHDLYEIKFNLSDAVLKGTEDHLK